MINKVMLVGRIGKDAEYKQFSDSENGVVKFSVATWESWKDRDGEWKERTEWHNVELFGKGVGGRADKLKKGAMVVVEGKITTDKWTDKDGNEKRSTKIKAMSVRLVPVQKSDSDRVEPVPSQDNVQEKTYEPETGDDGLPF